MPIEIHRMWNKLKTKFLCVYRTGAEESKEGLKPMNSPAELVCALTYCSFTAPASSESLSRQRRYVSIHQCTAFIIQVFVKIFLHLKVKPCSRLLLCITAGVMASTVGCHISHHAAVQLSLKRGQSVSANARTLIGFATCRQRHARRTALHCGDSVSCDTVAPDVQQPSKTYVA